eukprot:2235181-Pleurochrysis_carterae.AAC.1
MCTALCNISLGPSKVFRVNVGARYVPTTICAPNDEQQTKAIFICIQASNCQKNVDDETGIAVHRCAKPVDSPLPPLSTAGIFNWLMT